MKPLFRQQLLILGVIGVLVGGGIAYIYVKAPPPHYCQAQQRYIPDEEFLKASIALLYWDMNLQVGGEKKKAKEVLSMYKGMDFDPTNPDCCAVGRDTKPSIFTRFFGNEEVEVRLNPRTSTAGSVSRIGDEFYFLNYTVCGELLDSSMLGPRHYTITTVNYLEITNRE